LVIECKNGSLSQTGISKTEMGQLEQAMTWFENNYGDAEAVIPVSIHPSSSVAERAEAPPNMRVIDREALGRLKRALQGFAREISPLSVLEDEGRVRGALASYKLSESLFLDSFARPVR
jgi:hypothetical protein